MCPKRYRRQEPFRYTFEEPLDAIFIIKEMDHEPILSKKGEAKIIDISPSGLRMSTKLDLPVKKHLLLHISFSMNNEVLSVEGVPQWEREVANNYHYGIEFTDESTNDVDVIEALKLYARGILHVKNKRK